MQYTCKELKQIARGALSKNWGLAIAAIFIFNIISNIASAPFSTPLSNLYSLSLADSLAEAGVPEVYLEELYNVAVPGTLSIVIAFAATLIISLIISIVSAGQCKLHLSMIRDEKPDLMDLFAQFKHRPDRFIVANLLLTAIQLACMIPMFVVAILTVIFAFSGNTTGALICALLIFIVYILSLVLMLYFQFKYSQIIFLLVDHPEMKVIESFKESSRIMKGNIGSYLYMSLSFLPMILLVMFTCGIGTFFVTPYMLTTQAAFYMDVSGDFWRRAEEARRLEEEMGPVLSE